MKVVFLITTRDEIGYTGKGGHYYSLRTIAESLSGKIECVLVNVGLKESVVIQQSKLKHYNVYFNGLNFLSSFRDLCRIIVKEKPSLLHTFDTAVFFHTKILSLIYKLPLINTKCGGANPLKFFPFNEHLILFSKENYNWFEKEDKFKNTKLYFLPNRSSKINPDYNRISLLRNELKIDNTTVVLRISRIGSHHEKSIIKSISLIKELSKNKFRVSLVLIGAIENKALYKQLLEIDDCNIKIVTDPFYTTNASALLDLADFVIATGRGVMEAASRSKVILIPSNFYDLPIVVTSENFKDLFQYNFSDRSILQVSTSEKNKSLILDLIKNESTRNELELFSQSLFKEYFDVNTIIADYLFIYKNVKFSNSIVIKDMIILFSLHIKKSLIFKRIKSIF